MRVACPLNFKVILVSKGIRTSSFWLASILLLTVNPSYAQLPPTNMGQFVHQPGDNQYTNQTQAERHVQVTPAAMSIAAPASATSVASPSSASRGYTLTPASPKPDVSLLPVVADEPIKPAGFPPLPDRLDLPVAGAGVWASGNAQASASGVNANVTPASADGISRDPQGVHQHYVHYQAGAFMPNQPVQQQNTYKPSSTDYYNINPSAKAGAVEATATATVTPSMQALQKMGPEPQLAADKVSKPEAPEAVNVNQSVSQDLSLPEDDFNKHYPTAVANSQSGRASKNAGKAVAYPARMLLYAGAGMAMGAASYGAMYALHR